MTNVAAIKDEMNKKIGADKCEVQAASADARTNVFQRGCPQHLSLLRGRGIIREIIRRKENVNLFSTTLK